MVKNPTEMNCWNACVSCHRCADKGKWLACADCSGRYDPARRIYPDPDDVCDCRNGILRWKTRQGQTIVAKLPGNPFTGKVQGEQETRDEREYQSYLKQQREKLGDESWDPIQYENGAKASAWMDKYKRGY